jgi:L-alanine-DL-glutamate epimerase-like enolase superfamily enzyme
MSIRIQAKPFELMLKYPFSISGYSRESTPLMLLEIELDGLIGLGEASMVPYHGENLATASEFLSKVKLDWLQAPFNFDELRDYLDGLAPGNPNIKAAIDIALHDLQGKIDQQPCWQYFDVDPEQMPLTSITIGMDSREVILKKVQEAEPAHILKVKLGGEADKMLIETIRSVTDKPLFVDANQGWKDRNQALELVHWLQEQGVLLIEQPMDKNNWEDNAWITEQSPIPILGDESIQRLTDVEKAKGVYHGINIKLMKSGGMHEAGQMIQMARKLDLKILIGCMSETSCATLAAAALAPLCDWADLDGPFLTKNNPFPNPDFKDGKWVLNNLAGLGIS